MASVTYTTYAFGNTIATGGGGLVMGGPINLLGNCICGTADVELDTDGCINMCANVVSCLCNPVANQDAATKCYVDECAGGAAGIWADSTNPFIVPCNSCNICVACVCIGVKLCACSGYFFANVSAGGSVGASTCLYSDKGCVTCIYAAELMRIPVGTNCY